MANKNKDIVIVGALRTPFGRTCGSLGDVDSLDLGAIPLREILKQINIPVKNIGEVFWSVNDSRTCERSFYMDPTRQSLIKAGLPHDTPSISLGMSGTAAMQAVKLAAMTIKSGEIDCAIAGGATSFSSYNRLIEEIRHSSLDAEGTIIQVPAAPLYLHDFDSAAKYCDRVAFEYGIDRVEQDEWAYRSRTNYINAWNSGKFREEIFPLTLSKKDGEAFCLDIDEPHQPNLTPDALSKLNTIHGTRAITEGNAAAMADGASAILLMTREKAIETGVQPLATIVANISMSIDSRRIAETPGFAIQLVCKKAGLFTDDLDLVEINEDFACIPLVSLRIIAGDDNKKLQGLEDKTNINGSSIATGNPTTATAVRIIMNLMYELRRRGGGYVAGTLCNGLAQADACVIKVE